MAPGNLFLVARRIHRLLGEVDIKETRSRLGLSDKLRTKLRLTIEDLAPLLVDAEKKSQLDPGVRIWLKNLEDVLYYADNLLDDLLTEASRRRLMNENKMVKRVCSDFFSSVLKILKMRHQKLESFWTGLDDIADRRRNFKLDKIEDETVGIDKKALNQRRSFLDLLRSNKKTEIINSLLLPNEKGIKENLKVLSIFGREGIGKTTLARDVFNDDKVKSHFEKLIWIPVSEIFGVQQILKEILARATGKAMKVLSENSMPNSLSTTRFLIVLDDVRISHDAEWNSLIESLKVGANGSVVLVITKLESVARRVKDSIRLNDLDEEQSKILFDQIVFGEEVEHKRKYHPHERRVRDEIVKRCAGHPLVIMAIASMLRSKSKEQWRSFNKSEFSKTVDRYNPFPLTKTDLETDNAEVLRLLKLCYDHLPSPLKHCFAYCSLFPKGFEIDVHRLIQLWMAQGFIIDDSGKFLEEVGYEYVLELLRGYFFEEVERDSMEKVTKCKLHTLMHDLAISVTGDHCRLLSEPVADSSTTFHAWFDFDIYSTEDIAIFDAKKLRTIVLSGQSRRRYGGIQVGAIFEKLTNRFRFLRALDMHASGLQIVPCSIGKLKLLKYLDLSENENITELPNSITELLSLQTLKLSMCLKLQTLPADFSNLVNLRYLEIEGCNNLTGFPRGICQLQQHNLKVLPQLVVSVKSSEFKQNLMKELRDTFQIRNLILKDLTPEKDVATYLEAVPSGIPSLSIEGKSHKPKSEDAQTPLIRNLPSDLEELSVNGFGSVSLFCPDSHFPSKLVKLTLSRCTGCKDLSAVHQIISLKVLILDDLPNLEHIYTCVSSASTKLFSTLEELWLTELPNLLGWWKNQDETLPSLCNLSKLVIQDCPKFVSMPLFPNVQEGLVLDRTSWKLFELTMNNTPGSSSSPANCSPPLSKLEKLSIVGIKDFEADKIEWTAFENLRSLIFDCLPKLQTLPTKLQEVTSLQELQVWRCRINKIPKWINKLQKLKTLVIRICPLLEKLPKEIRSLRIQTLEIEDCNTLLRRCEKDIGADWDKISNIPEKKLGRISTRW